MLRPILFVISVLSGINAFCQEASLSKFAFQEIYLNMPLSAVPSAYKGNCDSSSDKRFTFCTHKTLAGTVPITLEITLVDERVTEIQAYFPSQEFDIIWSALNRKYGQNDKRDANRIEWHSNPMQSDKPIPDELILFRKPVEQPKPDGINYLSNIEYSVIHYISMATARNEMKRRLEELDRKVKNISDGL